MSASPSRWMTIGDFLLRRLEEAGVGHLFGVPGDFNLDLLQQLEDTGTLKWVGTCNELNASYAADGYARLNGMAAFTVTNAVGALGAINGVAGSYAEHVPVICIAGSIPLRSIERGLGMHHTMGDGTWDRFLGAFAQVTAAQARLTPRNAVTEIDRLILTAWREKLPVYLELPSDFGFRLPPGCTVVASVIWGSIGYSVGALLGTLTAAPQRRHLLFVGDGSFQETAQELSTMLRHDCKPVIFLINNGGYTIERGYMGKTETYNDVATWAYADLPKVFRPDTTARSFVVKTVADLHNALSAPNDTMIFIEAVMDPHDAPAAVIHSSNNGAELDYGPRGPQHRPNAQLQPA
jgi:TPP-dependent 2-oxoacid decarboxylase